MHFFPEHKNNCAGILFLVFQKTSILKKRINNKEKFVIDNNRKINKNYNTSNLVN